MATNSVENILKGAHKTMDSANSFTHSVTGGKPSSFTPKPVVAEKPKTDYSHARAARMGIGDEVESAAQGLKAKQENVDQYSKSTE